MKDLTIIIPIYNEYSSVLKRTLDSLNIQFKLNKDNTDVIIINDNGRGIKLGWFKQFHNLDIKYYYQTINKGPGQARQQGIDMARSKYITFIDNGDIWTDAWAYHYFTEDCLNKDLISCWYPYYVEKSGGNPLFKDLYDDIWVFSKFFKLDYLRHNNIRFHPKLFVNEDIHFMRTFITNVFVNNESYECMHLPIYGKTFNRESLSFKNDAEILYTAFDDYLFANADVWDRFSGDINTLEYSKKCINAVFFTAYYALYNFTLRPKAVKYIDKCIQTLKSIYAKYKQYLTMSEEGFEMVKWDYKEKPPYSYATFLASLEA